MITTNKINRINGGRRKPYSQIMKVQKAKEEKKGPATECFVTSFSGQFKREKAYQ